MQLALRRAALRCVALQARISSDTQYRLRRLRDTRPRTRSECEKERAREREVSDGSGSGRRHRVRQQAQDDGAVDGRRVQNEDPVSLYE